MDKKIEDFIKKRPEVIAAYGYGSGVFKQSGYTKKDKPQIDLILVVDDLKKWHNKNIKLNRKDYSFMGKIFFKTASIKRLKGKTGITYVSNILENDNIYKYGTIEEKDLLNHLRTWDSFYLPGRFQKTIYPIIETKELKEAIISNRENALLVSSILQNNNTTTKKAILVTLCGLSYFGDTRMKFAENPRKVLNIVEGSFNEYEKIYKFNKDYLKEDKNGIIIVDKEKAKKKIKTLPKNLLISIESYLDKDDFLIKEKIYNYFEKINKKESTSQTIKGIWTNGIYRSVKYASKKVLKKFKK